MPLSQYFVYRWKGMCTYDIIYIIKTYRFEIFANVFIFTKRRPKSKFIIKYEHRINQNIIIIIIAIIMFNRGHACP